MNNKTINLLKEFANQNSLMFENGVIYVISDEFSTYAVAYKDTLVPKSPDTGEEVTAEGGAESVSLNVAAVVAIAAVTLAGAAIFAKRK